MARVQLRRAVQNLVRFPGMVLHCTSSVVQVAGPADQSGPADAALRLALTRPEDGASCTLVLPCPLLVQVPSLKSSAGAPYADAHSLAAALTPDTAPAITGGVSPCIVLLPGPPHASTGVPGLAATVRLGGVQHVDAEVSGLGVSLSAVVVAGVGAVSGAPGSSALPLPMDLLVFPTTPDDVPSSARLLSAAWLSALPSVCALVGCGPGDARAVSGYLGVHRGVLGPLVAAMGKDVEAWS